MEKLTNKNVSLWTRTLPQGQQELLKKLYYDVNLTFNDSNSDIHLMSLNYLNTELLENILPKINGKEIVFYYQNQKYHLTNEEKDNELQTQLNNFIPTISKYRGFSWWTYIRHFIIRTQ